MKYNRKLYGAILGDLSGQPHEFPAKGGPIDNVILHNPDGTFTDDTLMTLASANFLLGKHKTIEDAYKDMGKRYPGDHYGKGFKQWIDTPPNTIGESYGNGCVMRISPFMYRNPMFLSDIIKATICSHSNEVSIESVIKLYNVYKVGLPLTYDEIKPFKKFEVIADKTVNFCINLTAQTKGTQNCIIKAIECGGDTDTNASICGELSNFYNKDITDEDVNYVHSKLPDYLLNILKEFNETF
jgi:ADP-ribosylglycohydrolase